MRLRVFAGPIMPAMAGLAVILLSFSSAQANCDCKKECPLESALPSDTGAQAELSTSEAEGLALMREEEKLARDVYAALYEKWQLRIFANIGRSEQKHMDATGRLVAYYAQPDPAEGNEPGAFVNVELQQLYDQLVAQGSQSLEGALRAGAAIEEIDILDLEKCIAQTQQEPMQLVYGNLLRASHNHLRAFSRQLQRRSREEYSPQYLGAEAYAQIVSAEPQRGRGGCGGEY